MRLAWHVPFARKNFVSVFLPFFAATLDPGSDSTMAPPCLLVGHWLSQSHAESAFQMSLSCKKVSSGFAEHMDSSLSYFISLT